METSQSNLKSSYSATDVVTLVVGTAAAAALLAGKFGAYGSVLQLVSSVLVSAIMTTMVVRYVLAYVAKRRR